MARFRVGSRAALERRGVINKLSVSVVQRERIDISEDILVGWRADSFDVVLVDDPVTEVTLDRVPVLDVDHIPACIDRTAFLPAARCVALDAEVTDRGGVLFGHGEAGEEEGIPLGLSHHRAAPVVPRFGICVVVAMAGGARDVGIVEYRSLVGLRPGHLHVPHRRGDVAGWRSRDREVAHAFTVASIGGIVDSFHLYPVERPWEVRDEP